MKIIVVDWTCGGLLKEGTKYQSGQSLEGDADDAFRVARELYDSGLNVMVKRNASHNSGTRRNPVIVPEWIMVAVDSQRFQQR